MVILLWNRFYRKNIVKDEIYLTSNDI